MKTTYTNRPTCGHCSMTYRTLRLARAHAQAHADRSGKPVHITSHIDGDIPERMKHVTTAFPRIYGPYQPCHPAGPSDPMWGDD